MNQRQEKDYSIYEWKEGQFLEQAGLVLSLASSLRGIHRIERPLGDCVYLVPEKFYQRAVKALKNTAKNNGE